jgi:hypothetical protein
MLVKLRDRVEKSVKINYVRDSLGVAALRLRRRQLWPCRDRKYLVVGCESSGTTPISHLLLRDGKSRFLLEGINNWVWDLYMSVYQSHTSVRDYPRLQAYDRIKVPGFAAILPQFVEEFPNTAIVYCVRDPRDMVASAFRTWQVQTREQLSSVSWVAETWLGISESDPVARLAIRWRTYLERSQQVAGVHYVRYEDFCADRPGFIKSLAEQLHLEIDVEDVRHRCKHQASEKSARNYQPKGPGTWRNGHLTEKDAAIIERICGPQMRQWGYL